MPVPSHVLIDSLSGPDHVPAKTPATANPAAIVTSSPTRPAGGATPASSGVGSSAGLGAVSAVSAVSTHSGGRTTSGSSVGSGTGVGSTTVAAGISCPVGDPDYFFCGSMSEALLHKYLDRALGMDQVSAWQLGDSELATPPTDPTDRFPSRPMNPGYPPLQTDHDKEIAMITNIGAKFAGGMIFFWESWDWLPTVLAQFKLDTDTIHAIDPDVICEGWVNEYITPRASYVAIPPWVFTAFGETPVINNFFYPAMLYANDHLTYADYVATDILDISQTEAQKWVYFLAASFIENGAEAVYLGQVGGMNYIDGFNGNEGLNKVANMIRQYAKAPPSGYGLRGARRGLVLVGAGAAPQGPVPADPRLAPYFVLPYNSIYYDPTPGVIGPEWQRQLLWDYHLNSNQEYFIPVIDPINYPCAEDEYYPAILDPSKPDWNDRTTGGWHPLGWYCAHTACGIQNDHGGATGAGCGYYPGDMRNPFWGYDCTWFLALSPEWRQRLIPYYYFQVKCLNHYTHYFMPGRLLTEPVVDRVTMLNKDQIYAAYVFGDDTIISNSWNDFPATKLNWVFHDFMFENVTDRYMDFTPVSSLVFVGDDKIYFIAQDNYIHGYMRVSDPAGDYNGGTWKTMSPSYAVAPIIPLAMQMQARSDLVASPDGNRLLYIGMDGFIYGFDIYNPWTYTYINYQCSAFYLGGVLISASPGGFMRNELITQGIRAVSSLIYTPVGIFYVGEWLGDGSKHVHGFVFDSGIWQTTSPSYSAVVTNPIGITEQTQAFGAITYDNNSNRLFYIGIDGLLYYFNIIDIWTYYYIECSRSYEMLALNLQIQGNLAIHYYALTDTTIIYFIAFSPSDLSRRLCCIEGTGSTDWELVTEVWDGTGDYFAIPQSNGAGNIAVSPDGSTIAYTGADRESVIFFNYVDEWNFPHTVVQINVFNDESNSFQFLGNDDLFYLSPASSIIMQHMKFDKAYCYNRATTQFP